jgi:uncharacterized protein GlcG (DUF336 family)
MTIWILLTGIAAASASQVQTANPLDYVPKTMPNAAPYGAPIGLSGAESVLNSALSESEKRTWSETCAVVDSGGNLVSLKRMDGAMLASIEVAVHKARVSVRYRRETKAFETSIQGGNSYQLTLDGLIAAPGGVPLVADGKIIGAIGCSGGTGSQDELVAQAGVAALRKR